MFLTISNFPNKKEFYRNKNGSGNRVVLYWYCRKEAREMGRIVQIDKRRLVWMEKMNTSKDMNSEPAEHWAVYIQSLLKVVHNSAVYSSSGLLPRQPVLFLVNPKSGSGGAMRLFEKQVVPILKESHLSYEVIPTLRANHARQLVASEDLRRWRAIVIVSGDGLVHEVYNGLFDREDWTVSCQIPVGVIPAGSGNGLACSIAWQGGGSLRKEMMIRQVSGTGGTKETLVSRK